MARRRKGEEDSPNHERWLVSYADFITLLFAFFVVMYSISSVNEGKYRVLSNSLTQVFQEPTSTPKPVQGQGGGGEGLLDGSPPSPNPTDANLSNPATTQDVPISQEGGAPPPEVSGVAQEPLASRPLGLDGIAAALEKALASLVNEGSVSISHTSDWVEVDMKSQLLFESGSARLSAQALGILGDVSGILRPLPNGVRVEGYTDNVPIRTAAYPSNWELSAARAASVVHLFGRLGVSPERMAAVAYGEYRPVADNATPEGRNRNRRVVLQVLAQSEARRVLDIQRGPGR